MTNAKSDCSLIGKSESGQREDEETSRKFGSVFSLSEKEVLIDHFPGYLYRFLPVWGRFSVSTNYFCFHSSQLLHKTEMIIPIRDLYGLKAQRELRFGHSGLIVVIKGHEELFLEFSSSRCRKACVALLEKRMEEVQLRSERGEADPAKLEAPVMEDLDQSAETERRQSIPPIVTHGEYKDWVEGHGIEFACVGGDPAELMKRCVDNGMFTVSFLKGGIQKFREWLDDLLQSSWEACQGSELFIESPSAMGGIHISKALQIPYFRAFTMPWTRTRAYPVGTSLLSREQVAELGGQHAFAVPEHRRGGSYNYMTYIMFDQVFWRVIGGQINRFRKHVLKINATTFDRLEQHKSDAHSITLFLSHSSDEKFPVVAVPLRKSRATSNDSSTYLRDTSRGVPPSQPVWTLT
ncbi:Sterol 3-beta-glucosyltransferase [Saitozyma podzolica]|uniref:Sterol 3-beta-glucosyltransferase n=1 Tax=Saitozyma podzolica TaxID=1890683 RepID=A0A427XWB9_9TREE|nr:Sterol 3-beta-glucosyltransferase [Saitozyma podzolica]